MPWVSGLWILLPWVFSLVILILRLCFPRENPFGRLYRSFIVSVFRCYGFLSPNHDVALFCVRMRWVDSLVYTQKTNAKLSWKIYRYTNLCNDLLHKFGINQGNIIKLYYMLHYQQPHVEFLSTNYTDQNRLREKYPHTEFFLVRIFAYSDWIRRNTEY